jgi:hypothetical protein
MSMNSWTYVCCLCDAMRLSSDNHLQAHITQCVMDKIKIVFPQKCPLCSVAGPFLSFGGLISHAEQYVVSACKGSESLVSSVAASATESPISPTSNSISHHHTSPISFQFSNSRQSTTHPTWDWSTHFLQFINTSDYGMGSTDNSGYYPVSYDFLFHKDYFGGSDSDVVDIQQDVMKRGLKYDREWHVERRLLQKNANFSIEYIRNNLIVSFYKYMLYWNRSSYNCIFLELWEDLLFDNIGVEKCFVRALNGING